MPHKRWKRPAEHQDILISDSSEDEKVTTAQVDGMTVRQRYNWDTDELHLPGYDPKKHGPRAVEQQKKEEEKLAEARRQTIPSRQGILYSDAWTDEDIRRANDTGQAEQAQAFRKPEEEEAEDEQEGQKPRHQSEGNKGPPMGERTSAGQRGEQRQERQRQSC